jgi:hypothetical protein
MLIVGFGLMLTAVTVFLAWNVYLKCREFLRTRGIRRAQREKSS